MDLHRVVLAPVGAARVERVRLRFTGDADVDLGAVGLDDVTAALLDKVLVPGGPAAEVVDADDLEVRLTPAARHGWTEVRWSDEVGAWEVPTSEAADAVLGQLTRRRLTREAAPHLHGGAVVDDEGRALLVLGAAGAGKSTLLAHLAASGLALLNDEQLAVHADAGLVTGFTRPIAVKPGGTASLPAGHGRDPEADHPQLLTAAALGAVHRLAGRPSLIVLPERGGARVAHERLDGPAALDALCAHNLDLVDRPVAALAAFAWLVTTAPVVRLTYREAGEAAASLPARTEPPNAPPLPWKVVDHGAGEGATPAQTRGVGRHTDHDAAKRAPHRPGRGGEGATPAQTREVGPYTGRDAAWVPAATTISVQLGDDVAVYDRSTRALVRLSREGSTVWRALLDPDDDGGVLDAPGTDDFLRELRHRGLVEPPRDPPLGGMTDVHRAGH